MSAIRATVWNENHHEQHEPDVRARYPDGIHGAIAEGLRADPAIAVTTATLDEPEDGLSEARLADTDVLLWWGHHRHADVSDAAVERVRRRVWQGMGLIMLHSGHFSKLFRSLMGTPCALSWRVEEAIERIWVIDPGHPIAQGLPPYFEIAPEEMYGEPFSVPEPMETVFISWFRGGEVFRSGLTYKRGAGRIFYFRPGDQAYPTYYHPQVRQVLRNAVRWAANPAPPWTTVELAPNVPADRRPEALAGAAAPGEQP
jgi:trehalose utilization protein